MLYPKRRYDRVFCVERSSMVNRGVNFDLC